MKTCTHCDSLFIQTAGSYGKFCSVTCASRHNSNIRRQRSIKTYLLVPKVCKHCNAVIPYASRHINKFCNHSCAATYNNAKKDWSSISTGPVPKLKPAKTGRKPRDISITDAVGPHTVIHLCTCKFTGKQWYSPTVKTIHPSAISTKKLYSYQCRFTFGIKTYPIWFSYAATILQEYGWYSASNRGNNLSGCSRDHMYSVSDGFKNNVDPMLISHPANCEIIPHRKNQSKNKKSIITLSELTERISRFNNQYLEMPGGVEPP